MTRFLSALVIALLAGTGAAAAEEGDADRAIRDALQRIVPDMEIGAIEPTPIDGLYSVRAGAEVFYVTADGRYLFQGELLDLEERRSLTGEMRREVRRERLAALDEDRMLVYEPDGGAEHEITVFTDIDCPYCRRFHRDMAGYHERGIRVRYLLMPRAGAGSDSYDKAVWAWCAEDPHEALTQAKNGQRIARRECDDPVDEHLALARELGVRGTPTIVTDSGTMFSGYRAPDELEAILERDRQGSVLR